MGKQILPALGIVLVSMALPPRAAVAQAPPFGIPNDRLLTELLMEYQAEQLMMIGRMFGPDGTSPLHFSSMVDAAAMSFSFQLVPGSSYLGRSMTLTGSGSFNPAAARFDRESSGALGSFLWTSAGTDIVTAVFAAAIAKESNEDFEDENGQKFMDAHDKATYNDQTGRSTITVQLTKADGSNDGDPNTGRDRLNRQGNWEMVLRADQFGFNVASRGFSPPGGGVGSFRSTISTVPEPATLFLLGSGLVVVALARKRRPRVGSRNG